MEWQDTNYFLKGLTKKNQHKAIFLSGYTSKSSEDFNVYVSVLGPT